MKNLKVGDVVKNNMDKTLEQFGTRLRKVICKVSKHTGARTWTVSLYGERTEVNGRIRTAKDIKFTGDTFESIVEQAVKNK